MGGTLALTRTILAIVRRVIFDFVGVTAIAATFTVPLIHGLMGCANRLLAWQSFGGLVRGLHRVRRPIRVSTRLTSLPLTVLSHSPYLPRRQYLCKGRVGATMITPSFVSDTSVTGRLSAVWVGQAANLKVSKSTSFGVNDLYFTTTVTLQNMGTVQMTAVNYMRNVDPDQEQVNRPEI
jgi:hypothetical protein